MKDFWSTRQFAFARCDCCPEFARSAHRHRAKRFSDIWLQKVRSFRRVRIQPSTKMMTKVDFILRRTDNERFGQQISGPATAGFRCAGLSNVKANPHIASTADEACQRSIHPACEAS